MRNKTRSYISPYIRNIVSQIENGFRKQEHEKGYDIHLASHARRLNALREKADTAQMEAQRL